MLIAIQSRVCLVDWRRYPTTVSCSTYVQVGIARERAAVLCLVATFGEGLVWNLLSVRPTVGDVGLMISNRYELTKVGKQGVSGCSLSLHPRTRMSTSRLVWKVQPAMALTGRKSLWSLLELTIPPSRKPFVALNPR